MGLTKAQTSPPTGDTDLESDIVYKTSWYTTSRAVLGRLVDGYLPFLLAITANSTTAATSRLSRTTAPQIKGMLKDIKG